VRMLVCSRMLTYAHVCSRMLSYAHVCSRWEDMRSNLGADARMLTYAHVCSRMLTYAHVCCRWEEMRRNLGAADANTRKRELQTYAHVCSRMLTYALGGRRCGATWERPTPTHASASCRRLWRASTRAGVPRLYLYCCTSICSICTVVLVFAVFVLLY
jgi:hypothetical protein